MSHLNLEHLIYGSIILLKDAIYKRSSDATSVSFSKFSSTCTAHVFLLRDTFNLEIVSTNQSSIDIQSPMYRVLHFMKRLLRFGLNYW